MCGEGEGVVLALFAVKKLWFRWKIASLKCSRLRQSNNFIKGIAIKGQILSRYLTGTIDLRINEHSFTHLG